MDRDHEMVRKEVWKEVAVACAAASNSTKANICVEWADTILKGFDERFPAPVKK